MRDHGTFCIFLPLKVGVGIACMLVFASSMVSILALLTSDIRFRATGYNQTVYYLPEIVGAFGIVFGFVGLLGTYDDKWYQLWWFNRYFVVKLAAMSVAVFADFVTLQRCEVWQNDPDSGSNPQLLALSEGGLCGWARWSYLVGCVIDLGVWAYLFVCSYTFEDYVRRNPGGYAIDFGGGGYDAQARWDFYKVKDPRKDRPLEATAGFEEDDPFAQYGAVRQDEEAGRYVPGGSRAARSRQPAQSYGQGYDPSAEAARYGPDGMRLP